MLYVCMYDKPNEGETGTVHKHPGNLPEPRIQVRSLENYVAFLSKAFLQEVARHSSAGQLGRALTGNTAGSGGWHAPGLVRTLSSSPCHRWTWLLQISLTQPGKNEMHARKRSRGRRKHAGENVYTSFKLNLQKIAGKIKFTGEQRELRPKMQSSSSNP